VRPLSVRTGVVFATGTTVHRGRRTATAEGRIVEGTTGRVLATATTTVLLQS
jgi:acyl-coenzyme A thioesterase PaaI-like protein